ncbi:unnamed protein product [Gordionus sp. m RMFG-2023]|uniref:large ribosomal subunit protein mL50-like n=1 Tax=Gordionus sp. m RMFG-2023 TaxID=3053472 RepID=UPI0030E036A7
MNKYVASNMLLPKILHRYYQIQIIRNVSLIKKLIKGNSEVTETKDALQTTNEFCKRSNLTVEETLLRNKAYGVKSSTIPYTPPENVEHIIKAIAEEILGLKLTDDWKSHELNDSQLRFKILRECTNKIPRRDIPNSFLLNLTTLGLVCQHFLTAIDVRSPLDIMASHSTSKDSHIPPNLHIKTEYRRFADNPQFFDNISAFPNRSTHVYNLKYKKLYKPYEAHKFWPYERE